jgi:hypothetical protein
MHVALDRRLGDRLIGSAERLARSPSGRHAAAWETSSGETGMLVRSEATELLSLGLSRSSAGGRRMTNCMSDRISNPLKPFSTASWAQR